MRTDTIEQDAESVEELRTRLDLFQSWHDDDRRRIELLEQHLGSVLEIAGTWQPDYATAMDRKTIQLARECLGQPTRELVYAPGEWCHIPTTDELERFYLSRLLAIREAAETHGYAIGVHGSLRRDMDLIAAPWREGAADAETLAHAIAQAACGIDRAGTYDWEQKPAGRVATSIPICWPAWHGQTGAGHIDLSVMPAAVVAAPKVAAPNPSLSPSASLKWDHDGQGGYYVEMRVNGIRSEDHAHAAMAYMERLFCGAEMQPN